MIYDKTKFEAVQDGDIMQENDLGFGNLSNGTIGWGKIPSYLVGEHYCEGYHVHPRLLVRRINPPASDRTNKTIIPIPTGVLQSPT